MIKEICLPLKDYTKYKNISKGMFAISELYLVSLPKFDSKKVFKCNIFLCEDRQFPTKAKILGFAISYQFFDFKKYLSLDEHFIVESNYKGLISDTWEVDISNGAVLATHRF